MDSRKRGKPEVAVNGAIKKTKQGMESLSTGVGSKLKPCTKFFSTSGCSFGEECRFLHYVPGGYNVVAQMLNPKSVIAPPISSRIVAPPPMVPNGSTPPPVKTRIAHGEWELGKPIAPSFDDHCPMVGTINLGTTSKAKISVKASLAGTIIGRGGENSKKICYQTGAKLSIREHESNPNLRNIELKGSFKQIKEATDMVRELISAGSMSGTTEGCKFGDKCHFAHGEWELGKPIAPSFDDHCPMVGTINLGTSSKAKISVKASLAGPIIGRGGENSKKICYQTRAKLSIREHESNPNLRNIELKGSFEQIKEATDKVRELISAGSMSGPPKSSLGVLGAPPPLRSNFKTKLCENFAKGSCAYAERCHFAHGVTELRKLRL